MYQDIVITIYLAHWLILAALYVYIRKKMKHLYPARHELIFGKSWMSHSVYNSIRFVKFALKKEQWTQIENTNLLNVLNVHRYIGISFLLINFILGCGILGTVIYASIFGN